MADHEEPFDDDEYENVAYFPTPPEVPNNDPPIVVPVPRILGTQLDVQKMIAMPTVKVKWLIDGIASETSIGLWSGPGGIGKSYVLMEMAIALAIGRPFFRLFLTGRPRRVGYFDLEMPKDDTIRRFQRMLKREDKRTDWSNLRILAEGRVKIDDPDSKAYKALREAIGDLKLDVVMFDSLRRLYVGQDKDSSQSDRVFDALKPLRDEFKCSFQIIAHWRKAKGDKLLDSPSERLAGSADWRNFVDTHVSVVEHPMKNHRVIFPDKGRQADKVPERFVAKFDHVNEADPDGPFRMIMAGEEAQKVSEPNNYDLAREYLQVHEKMTIKDLSQHLGIRMTSAAKIVRNMEEYGDANVDKKSKPFVVSSRIVEN